MSTDTRSRDRTDFLSEAVGGKARLATILQVNRSQPTRWSQGAEIPTPARERQMIDLAHVLDRAHMLWTPKVALTWLEGSNTYLDGARPIDVLLTRGASEVLDALDAAEAGVLG